MTLAADRCPINALSGPSIGAGRIGIQQDRLRDGSQLIALLQVLFFSREVGAAAAKGANHGNGRNVAGRLQQFASRSEPLSVQVADQIGRLIPVKLDAEAAIGTIEIGLADRPEDVVEAGIDENAKNLNLLSRVLLAQAIDDLARVVGTNESRAFFVKVDADGVCARLRGQ